ncbi:MAG: glycerol acyltransferase [Bacteroidales bacterium]|jgi:1-acyl-sn-glycerol-3-phosphate acyltransferase|nr:glycerol acyltransferase [Bacteroidales bacterium]
MSQDKALKIDVRQVIAAKSPSLAKKLPGFVINRIKKLVHQDEINEILSLYGHYQGVEFATHVLAHLGITYTPHGMEKIDPSGRYIFVSNHPLGGLDGMVLISLIGTIFPDIKFVVNDFLMHVKPFEPLFIPVNKVGKMSREYAQQINDTYSSDSQILYFPAGLCSRKIKGKITDTQWRPNFLKKAIAHNRDIVPIFFSGRNSNFFYALAKIRKFLRIKFNIEMLFLPHELFKQKNSSFEIWFGDSIPIGNITSEKSLREWTDIIRDKAYEANNPTG